MNWGQIRDRIVEGRWDTTRGWILLDREERVLSIYVKIDEVSKFLPADEFEETLDGAKLRAELEIERFFEADRIAKLNLKK
jgi:hypothetical protein